VEVLELGFGLGTNLTLFMECWAARLREPSRGKKAIETLVFHSIEAHPLEASELRRAWQQLLQTPCPTKPLVTQRLDAASYCRFPKSVEPDFSGRSCLDAARRGVPAWIAVLDKDRCYRLPGLHRFELLPGFYLDLHVGDATRVLRQCSATPQVVLLDGFAPNVNPQMWNEKLLRALRRLLPVDALLLGSFAAPGVLELLGSLDFLVTRKSRAERKRHRLEALYHPRGIARQLALAGSDTVRAPLQSAMLQRLEHANNSRGPRSSLGHMVILGAGLAGRTLAAEALLRGWSVVLLDPRSAANVEACALPAYLEHLHLSPDDNPLARLTRAALLLGRRSAHDEPLQTGRIERLSSAEADRWGKILARLRERSDLWPDPWEELLALYPGRVPPALHLLRAAALPLPPLTREFQREALPASLHHAGGAWRVIDEHGALLAEGDVIVGACVPAIGLMCPPLVNRLHCTPGASVVLDLTTLSSSHPVWELDALFSGKVQVVRTGSLAEPTCAPFLQIGALHEDAPGDQVHARLLEGVRETLGLDAGPLAELCRLPFRIVRGDRFSAYDHLPMIGALPDLSQVQERHLDLHRNARLAWPRRRDAFLLSALGSRGVLWSRLGAWLILDELDGLPPIIARDLCAAIDPARFLIRDARKGVGHNPAGHV
jgi:tRNA 5-methylaminomethyl-2-thiouridine biosynthesis bifunctional protein